MFQAGVTPPGMVGLLGEVSLHDGWIIRYRLGLGPRQCVSVVVPDQFPSGAGDGVLPLPDIDANTARRIRLRRGGAGRLRQAHPGAQRPNEGSGQYLGPVAWDFQSHQDARDNSGSFFLVYVIHFIPCYWLMLCIQEPLSWHEKGRSTDAAA